MSIYIKFDNMSLFRVIISLLVLVVPFLDISAKIGKLTIDVRDYGAVGDSITLNTEAFNKAISFCSENGGGTVYVPAGIFLTGTILLKSNVCLYLVSDAVIKGTNDLSEYKPYIPKKELDKYENTDKYNWNRALLLGVEVENVKILGSGVIDGCHVVDPQGEENMRGPHTILFADSRNIELCGVRIVRSANYAFMAYEIEDAFFFELLINEGWDGIHIRGGKNTLISDCEFCTGDDAIAGGYWDNMIIKNCKINSSCNGIRMIMPANNLKIEGCSFKGPGLYPHRTSKERKRNNMLSAILLQPGGWGKAPGFLDNILIEDIEVDSVDNPIMFVLNQENACGSVLVENFRAKNILKSALSFESWQGGEFKNVTMKNISIEYKGDSDISSKEIIPKQPHVDCRKLPSWGGFFKNIKQLNLEKVGISYVGEEFRPSFYLDSVQQANFVDVKVKDNKIDPIVRYKSGNIEGEIVLF